MAPELLVQAAMKTKHLGDAQKVALRQALMTKRSQLVHDVERLEDEQIEGAAEAAELEDVAEAVIEDRRRMALEERDRVLLEEVEHALAKLDAGTYGVCEQTGRPIPFERLLAIPWARYEAREAERIERASRP